MLQNHKCTVISEKWKSSIPYANTRAHTHTHTHAHAHTSTCGHALARTAQNARTQVSGMQALMGTHALQGLLLTFSLVQESITAQSGTPAAVLGPRYASLVPPRTPKAPTAAPSDAASTASDAPAAAAAAPIAGEDSSASSPARPRYASLVPPRECMEQPLRFCGAPTCVHGAADARPWCPHSTLRA